jgi:NTP pyrophosphatase (non-canonical NTP hydrolase)
MTMSELAEESHDIAVAHGWWHKERGIPEMLCLIHCEISEALQEYRNGRTVGEELADAVIRIFDMCEGLGINIEEEVKKKNRTNRTRDFRHGGKVC